jgi:hypothetical protein
LFLKSDSRHTFAGNGYCGASFLQLSKKSVDFCRNAGECAGALRAQCLRLFLLVMAGQKARSAVLTSKAPAIHVFSFVMPGHSRPKDGVLSHAYVPGIHVFYPHPGALPSPMR